MDSAALHAITEVSRRRVGYRMTCARCEVCWTGAPASPCWICGGPGRTGPGSVLCPEPEG